MRVQNRTELTRAFWVGARRYADEEMLIGLTDISSVHRSRFNNLQSLGAVCKNRLFDQLDFTQARRRTGSHDDCRPRAQNRRIFHERTIWIPWSRRQYIDGQSACTKRVAIPSVLFKSLLNRGCTLAGRGQPVRESSRGKARYRVLKTQRTPSVDPGSSSMLITYP